MTSILCRKVKDETLTFPAHRFLRSDCLACANKIKVNVVNATRDAEELNIRIQEIRANARGFRSFDRTRISSKARLLHLRKAPLRFFLWISPPYKQHCSDGSRGFGGRQGMRKGAVRKAS